MKNSVIKRVWAWLMVACMLFTMVPAFAEEADVTAPEAVEAEVEVVEAAEAEEEAPAEEPEAPAEEAEVAPVEEAAEEPEAPAEEAANDAVAEIASTTACPYCGSTSFYVTGTMKKGDCTTRDLLAVRCGECNKQYSRWSEDVHHEFEYVELVATCTTPKMVGERCKNCKAENPKNPLKPVGDALGHQWGPMQHQDATCTEDGYDKKFCTRQLTDEFGSKLYWQTEDHRGETEPTTTVSAYPAICDGEDGTVLPKTGHKTPAAVDPVHRKQLPATCTKPAREAVLCANDCGTELEVTPVEGSVPTGHSWTGANDGWIAEDGNSINDLTNNWHYRTCTNPNCDGGEDGEPLTQRSRCIDTIVTAEIKEATCKDPEETTVRCLLCGDEVTYQSAPKLTTHRPEDLIQEIWYSPSNNGNGTWAPSTQRSGKCGWNYKNIRTRCIVCGWVDKEGNPYDNPENFQESVKIEHHWVKLSSLTAEARNAAMKDNVTATCFRKGNEVWVCDRDGQCTNGLAAADVTAKTAVQLSSNAFVARKDVTIEMQDHDYNTTLKSKPATCLDDEILYYPCKYCDTTAYPPLEGETAKCTAPEKFYQTVPNTATGHRVPEKKDGIWDDDIEYVDTIKWIVEGTCTEAGKLQYVCPNCQKWVEETVPPEGHKMSDVIWRAADCEHPERTSAKCTICGWEDDVTPVPGGDPALQHSWSSWTSTTKLDADDSNYVAPKYSEDAKHNTIFFIDQTTATHIRKCSLCGKVEKRNCSFTKVESVMADCKNAGHTDTKCAVCGIMLKTETMAGKENLDQHTWSEWKFTTDDDPDVATEVNKKLETLPEKKLREPSCTSGGYGFRRCTNVTCTYDREGNLVKGTDMCTEIDTISVVPKQHKWKKVSDTSAGWGTDKPVDINQKGTDTYKDCLPTVTWYYCERCTADPDDATEDQPYAPRIGDEDGTATLNGVLVYLDKRVEEPKGDHYFTERVEQGDCTADAYVVFKCDKCETEDETRGRTPIPGTKSEHEWKWLIHEKETKEHTVNDSKGKLHTAIPATCTHPGLAARECKRCGKVEENQEIAMLDHKPSSIQRFRPADCLFPDRYVVYCTVCQQDLEEYEVQEGGTEATDHKFSDAWTPDPNRPGMHIRHCTNYGCPVSETYQYVDKDGKPVTVTTAAISAACDYTSEHLEASCQEPARTVYTCKLCGYQKTVYDEGSTYNPNGHVWEIRDIEGSPVSATCTKNGVGRQVCIYCGEVGKYVVQPAGHAWNEGVVTKEATCTEEGEITYTCTRGANCSEYSKTSKVAAQRKDTLPKIEHRWHTVVLRAATCAVEGKKLETCVFCGAINPDTTIEKLAHSYITVIDDNSMAYLKQCTKCGNIEFDHWSENLDPELRDCSKVTYGEWTLAHDEEEREEIPPEGDKPGHQAGVYCKRCERYTAGGDEIEPTEHTDHTPYMTVGTDDAGTCFISYCSVCGWFETPLAMGTSLIDWDPDLPEEQRDCTKVTKTVNGKTWTVEEHGEREVIPGKEPTETEAGWTAGEKCKVCGQVTKACEPLDPIAPPVKEYPKTLTTIDLAILRLSASDEGEYFDYVEAGVEFVVNGPAVGGFYEVTYNGTTCYIHEDYLK